MVAPVFFRNEAYPPGTEQLPPGPLRVAVSLDLDADEARPQQLEQLCLLVHVSLVRQRYELALEPQCTWHLQQNSIRLATLFLLYTLLYAPKT